MKESDRTIENTQENNSNQTEKELLSTFLINGIDYRIIEKSNSKKEGERLGLKIKNAVPIYYLDGYSTRKGAFHIHENYILMFSNADEETLKHEIIHSIAYRIVPPEELEDFYSIVKDRITEDSFKDGAVSFNFAKNIHEFIADGYSKTIFINALKKENLYEEFLEKTAYLFE